ncbi:hypothetical protein Rsub_05275 [Raphidocelis subcapitata]|uniref:Wax synthase domain-containing protein n=1 Tax=Raphidocelis subcapitata TaxID=307507 RepID=A0A2V0P2W1_9CHLO|nr:hypothetical protein Rsub_05275 [Raphidocelis subcapitata]|eukprot:GBF92193.1 hypothetical protein Rsub_05275 [Raphidocelis subcapitata]
MGLAALGAAYAFLSLYPALLTRVRTPGVPRLLAIVPGVAVCLWTPALVAWGIPRVVVGCITMWLSVFKLISWAAGRGPLSRDDLSLLQRTLLFLLPIHPRTPRWGKPPSASWIVLVLAGKVALQAAVALVLANVTLHPFLVHSLWAVCIWNMVAMGVDATAPFVQAAMGIPLNPSMNQPYLSITIQEFWSQRYNLVTTTCLRQTVYEPIIDGAFVRPAAASPAPPSTPLSAAGEPGAAAAGLGSSSSSAATSGSDSESCSATTDSGSGSGSGGAPAAAAAAGEDAPAPGLRRRRGARGGADDLRRRDQNGGGAADDAADDDVAAEKRAAQALAAARDGAASDDCLLLAPEAGGKAPVAEWRKSLATAMVFVASGVMHEMLIWYMCNAPAYTQRGTYVFGPVLIFFALQAPAMQAEKWVLNGLTALRRRLSRGAKPSPKPAAPRGPLAAAAGAALRVAFYAARVVAVYAWLWGLADFTFWRSTQSCRLEEQAIPEILSAIAAARGAAARLAEAAQLAWQP